MRAAVALALLLAAVPLAAPEPGGGTVQNLPPEVDDFRRDGVARYGAVDVLSGLLRDPNGAADLARLEVRSARGQAWYNLTVPPSPPGAEPAAFSAGWKVWTLGDNGSLAFRVRHVHSVPGPISWNLTAWDQGGSSSQASLAVVVASGGGVGGGGGENGGQGGGGDAAGAGDGAGGEAAQPSGSGHLFDITRQLSGTRTGDDVRLVWESHPGVAGYQVWRSDAGGWTLVAETPADTLGATDRSAPGARYKLTFFLEDGSGHIGSDEVADLLSGWDPTVYWQPFGEIQRGLDRTFLQSPAGRALLLGLLALLLLAFLVRRRARRRRSGQP